MFYYSRDRRGEHPQAHLADYAGILQADAFSGYNKLYEVDRKPGPIVAAGCWAHARRPFFVLADIAANARRKAQDKTTVVISPLALEAVRRIDALFDIERSINGASAAQRRAVRQELSAPLVAELEVWLREQRAKLSRGNDLAKAMDYLLKRWPAFTRFLEDGRICLSNNAAERAMRSVAMARSLYPSSSSVCKHCKLIFVIDATRASHSPDRGSHSLTLQIRGSDLIWSARHNLLGEEDAVLDQPADAVMCDAKRRRGFGHREPFAAFLGGTVGVDAVYPSHRADTVRGPGFSLPCRHAHPVQRRSDVLVRPATCHTPHHGERLLGCAAAMFAGLRLTDPQLRVLAAAPMDRQNDFARRVVDIGNNVGDEGA
jgi:hypothetical protein